MSMNEQTGTQDSRRAGHELTDLRAKYILLSAVILACAIAGAYVVVLETFNHLSPAASSSAQTLEGAPQLFPAPRLQVDPQRDLEQLKASERQLLDSYGWVDRERGVVRIPIERAMDLVSERGLPDFNSATKSGGTK